MRVGHAISSAVLLCGAAVLGQSPAPEFEVVSIKPVPPNAPMTLREVDFTPVLPGGQYINSTTLPLFLIVFAYDVKNPTTELTGYPAWVKEQSFSVAAKPASGFPLLPIPKPSLPIPFPLLPHPQPSFPITFPIQPFALLSNRYLSPCNR